MGTAERREREKEQRRNDIIDAAEKVFFSKGIETSTMDEVAETAELSKGTLYLYFKSKEELFHAICQRAGIKLMELFLENVKENLSGLENIRSIGRAYYEFSVKYPDYFNFMKRADGKTHCDCENDEEAVKAKMQSEKTMGIVEKYVGEGIKDGSIRADLDPVATAMLLYGMSKGVIQLMNEQIPMDSKHHIEDKRYFINYFFEFVRHGLTPQG